MLEVLYEDNQIIVVKKPQNVLSQSDITNDEDMLSLVKAYIKEKYNKAGEAYIGLVHRLDRPTGGVMVFARTSKSASRLCKQIEEKTFTKVYYAVLCGIPTQKSGKLVNYLIKDEATNVVSVCGQAVKGAKKAVLTYEILATHGDYSLARIEIETGRSHQIRVQMSTLKTPLFGDAKYGSKNASENLALWATKISFSHPVTGVKMNFVNMPPLEEIPWKLFTEFDFKKEDLR